MRNLNTFITGLVILIFGTINTLQANTNIMAPPPPPPVAAVTNPNPIPTAVCIGDVLNFEADNSTGNLITFQWNFNGAAAGPQTQYGQNVAFTAGAAGSYVFDLIVGDGTALDTFSFPMVVNSCTPPTINVSGVPTTICQGGTVSFVDATIPGSTPITGVDWVFQGGTPGTVSNTTQVNPVITYNTPGTYNVIYVVQDGTGTYGDTLIAYINVLSCPPPTADFGSDKQLVCPNQPINFTDSSLNVVPGLSTWTWNFIGSDSTISIQQNPVNIRYQVPGIYDVTLTVTNPNGTNTETKVAYIEVDSCLSPEAKFTVEKTKICQRTCVQFFNTSLREDSLEWQFIGADSGFTSSTESNPIVCYSDTGKFDVLLTVKGTLVNGDIESDFAYEQEYISVKPYPFLVAPKDTSVLIGKSVKLLALGEGQFFQWRPAGSLDCEFCNLVTATPDVNTKYYVSNSNENGCTTTDSVNVVVIKNYYRGIPTAFTPNNDGENDKLLIYGNAIADVEFYVYDRHGRQVFVSRDQNMGWDGTYNGEPMEAGVYMYFAKITFDSGYQEILKGDVTLVR